MPRWETCQNVAKCIPLSAKVSAQRNQVNGSPKKLDIGILARYLSTFWMFLASTPSLNQNKTFSYTMQYLSMSQPPVLSPVISPCKHVITDEPWPSISPIQARLWHIYGTYYSLQSAVCVDWRVIPWSTRMTIWPCWLWVTRSTRCPSAWRTLWTPVASTSRSRSGHCCVKTGSSMPWHHLAT